MLNSLSQVDTNNCFNYSTLKHSEYIFNSTNDTLLFDNELLIKINTSNKSKLEVFSSSSKTCSKLAIILPGPDSSQIIWYSVDVDRYEFKDFNNDHVDELIIELTCELENVTSKKFLLLSFNSASIDAIFQIDGFSNASPAENSNMISKTFFYKIKDYDKDSNLDLKVKTIRKYPKDRNCDCDKDHYYRIRKQVFYFKNGEFIE